MEDLKVIESGIKDLLSKMNYELYSLKFLKRNKEYTLEVIVDRDEDISMDDIVKVSEAINAGKFVMVRYVNFRDM